jgi:branched-chain amino acid transport system permease protein
MVSGIASAVCIALVCLYLYRTRIGYVTRAVMSQRDEALSTGINVHAVSALAFGISLALAAVAGVLAPFMFGSIVPAMGVAVTITSFAVIVMGSLGQPLGTVLGGMVYGVALMFMQTYASSWANLLPYLVLILILLVRPTGLLGKRVRHA